MRRWNGLSVCEQKLALGHIRTGQMQVHEPAIDTRSATKILTKNTPKLAKTEMA